MRSTTFVILSILVHAAAVAAIALSPRPISETEGSAAVEVNVGEPAPVPGVPEQPEEKVTTGVDKSVEKIAKPAPAKKQVLRPAPAPARKTPAPEETAAAPAPAPAAEPENLDPALTEDIPVAPASDASADQDHESQSEAAEPESEGAQSAADPVALAAPTGASDEINSLTEGGELGHGGATKAGAVEYTELKQIAGNKAPLYPLQARKEKRQGAVELLYRVTKQGHVTDVSVAKSSGFRDLDAEAVNAISKFRFVPGQEGWAKHLVQFSLKGETAALPSRLRVN